MSVINKKLLRTVLPPDWVEVTPSDRGYCYLYCIQHKYQQRMAYHLGAQPDWDDVLKCGFLRRTAIIEKRKNLDGTYHVFPSSCGVSPFDLRFPPGAMVGNKSIVNIFDICETIVLVLFGGFFMGFTHIFLAIERALRCRPLGSVDLAFYGVSFLLFSSGTLAVETAGESKDAQNQNNNQVGNDSSAPMFSVLEDDDDYIPSIIFNEVEVEYLRVANYDLPNNMLCILDDDFRHKILSVEAKGRVIKEYLVNRCPQLSHTTNDRWFKEAKLIDMKVQMLKADDYTELARSAVKQTNEGVKTALKNVGAGIAETATLASDFVDATTTIIENTSKDAIKILKDNDNAIVDGIAKVKDLTGKFIEVTPKIDGVIEIGKTTVTEVQEFADELTKDVRSGKKVAELSKNSVSAVYNEFTDLTNVVYSSTKNLAKQVYQDSYSSEDLSRNTRQIIKDLVTIGQNSPKSLYYWATGMPYKKTWIDTIEGVPWMAKIAGKTIAAPIMGAAQELDEMDRTWLSARGLSDYKKAIFGDWSDFMKSEESSKRRK